MIKILKAAFQHGRYRKSASLESVPSESWSDESFIKVLVSSWEDKNDCTFLEFIPSEVQAKASVKNLLSSLPACSSQMGINQ